MFVFVDWFRARSFSVQRLNYIEKLNDIRFISPVQEQCSGCYRLSFFSIFVQLWGQNVISNRYSTELQNRKF